MVVDYTTLTLGSLVVMEAAVKGGNKKITG
jgi:hypothetical protein